MTYKPRKQYKDSVKLGSLKELVRQTNFWLDSLGKNAQINQTKQMEQTKIEQTQTQDLRRGYSGRLDAIKLENIEEMDKFLETESSKMNWRGNREAERANHKLKQ